MSVDIVDALKSELTSHGADGFRLMVGTKHDRLYFTHGGVEQFHVVSKGRSDINQRVMFAIQDVRRMIGVNQGSGPGERRQKTVGSRRGCDIPPPPETFTVTADPMAILIPLKEKLEMESLTEVAPIRRGRVSKKIKEAFVMPVPLAREREWLAEMLKRGERERHIIAKRKVTPGLAAAMLELNMANRPVTEAQVRTHEARLRRGDFILTHHGISFAKTGVLNDGQHRLLAIARTGISGDLQVTFGAERDEFKVIDMGRARRAMDTIGMTTKDWPALRASIARIILIAEMKRDRGIDPQLVAEKAIVMRSDAATDIAMALASTMRKVCNPTPPAAAYYWIATHSPNALRVNEFFQGLSSGEGLTGLKLRLREWLRDPTVHRVKAPGAEGFWRVGGIILAWNAWIKGQTRVSMDWRSQNELPEVK